MAVTPTNALDKRLVELYSEKVTVNLKPLSAGICLGFVILEIVCLRLCPILPVH